MSQLNYNISATNLKNLTNLKLSNLKQWVLWKAVTKDGKPTKVPYKINGKLASVKEPNAWSTFEEVHQVLINSNGIYNGTGIVLTKDNLKDYYLVFVDLDIKISEFPTDIMLKDLFEYICFKSNSYAEYSPSKKGMHIILKISKDDKHILDLLAMKTTLIEVYYCDRYMTMTGDKLEGISETINFNNEFLEALLSLKDKTMEGFTKFATYFGIKNDDEKYSYLIERLKIKEETSNPLITSNPVVVDRQLQSQGDELDPATILQKIMASDEMRDDYILYSSSQGNIGDMSASQCDMALINILVYFNEHNREQAIAMFKGTIRGQRDKCKRDDYIARTFDEAYKSKTSFYQKSTITDAVYYHNTNGELITKEKDNEDPFENDINLLSFENAEQQEAKEEDDFDVLSKEENEIADSIEDKVIPYLVKTFKNSSKNPFTVPVDRCNCKSDFNCGCKGNLMSKITKFLYYQSPYPNIKVALMGAFGFLGVLCGNVFSVGSLGLNLYCILLASTGFGKSALFEGVKKLMNRARKYFYVVYFLPKKKEFADDRFSVLTSKVISKDVKKLTKEEEELTKEKEQLTKELEEYQSIYNTLEDLCFEGDVSSGQAVSKGLSDNNANTFPFCIDEIGEKFSELNNKKSHQHGVLIALLECYTSSSVGNEFSGKKYAKSEDDLRKVPRASVNVLSASNPKSFWRNVSIKQFENGTINRFFFFEAISKEEDRIKNDNTERTVDKDLLEDIIALVRHTRFSKKDVYDINDLNYSIPFSHKANISYNKLKKIFSKIEKEYYKNDDDLKASIIIRKLASIDKIAGLLAISDNFIKPVIHNKHLFYARNLVEHNCALIENKLNLGEIGSNQEEIDQINSMKSTLYDTFFVNTHSSNKEITNLMFQYKVVSNRYIKKIVGKKIAFSVKGSNFFLDQTIKILVNSNYLTKIDKDFSIKIFPKDPKNENDFTEYNNDEFRKLVKISKRNNVYLVSDAIKDFKKK